MVLVTFITLLLSVVVFQPLPCKGDENDTIILSIHIPGEQERKRFDNKVMVTGLWHYVNITFDETLNPSTVNLILHKGDTIPVQKNEETYYSWEYDGAEWKDSMSYGAGSYTYIDETRCAKTGTTYAFYIGTDDFVDNNDPNVIEYENWTIVVKADNTKVFSTPIVMEEPVAGVSATRADFTLTVEPFTQTVLKPVQEFITGNTGNVPMYIHLVYNKLNDSIVTSNIDTTLHPGETLSHAVEVTTKKWEPGYVSISGRLYADALYVVPTGFISFDTSIDFNGIPRIIIQVGHSNYELEEIKNSDITFQYKKNIEMNYGETKNITAYVCGNGNITISITNSNITLLNVWNDNVIVEDVQNFTVHSTNSTEHQIVVQLHASKPNATAYILYSLKTHNTTHVYTTTIIVGPETLEKEEHVENTIAYIVVGLAITGVVVYMIYNQFRYRR
ncbi:MAG TPA: hypothetical protein ENI42_02590 [Thermoplasmatales archaeon]|nr:hypothetical protein [Thermoplasmatales archaeon]